MYKFFSLAMLTLSLLFSLPGYALSPAADRYLDLLANGGPISIRDAAKSIYNTGEKDPQVLDALAETLLQNYQKSDRDSVDAMAWACRALGNSGNARYRDTLKEVVENGGHKKLKKYAKKSLNQLGDGDADQYKKGALSVSSLKNNSTSNTSATTVSAKNTNLQPLTVIKAGMSMSEVYDLVGQPTATTSRQTGKAWIPFNYKGADNVRTTALYKGQGKVIFANESNFSSGWRVIETQLDKNESGYP